MQPQGRVKLKEQLEYTEYFWGDISEIAGKEWPYMEWSVDKSSCLALVPDKGLVDVDVRDIESSYETRGESSYELFTELLKIIEGFQK